MYAKIEGNVVVKAPYSLRDFKIDHPGVSPPNNLGALVEFGVVPAEEQTVKIATGAGSDTVRERGDWQYDPTTGIAKCVTTIRDMTQAELDARTAAQVQSASDSLDNQRELKALAAVIWHIKKGTAPATAFDSLDNYKQWLRQLL